MKNAKISRRSFLLGLAACSAAGVLTACKGTDAPPPAARLPLPQSRPRPLRHPRLCSSRSRS